jgi:hypothetical protein
MCRMVIERKAGKRPWRWWKPYLWQYQQGDAAWCGDAWTIKSAKRQGGFAAIMIGLMLEGTEGEEREAA